MKTGLFTISDLPQDIVYQKFRSNQLTTHAFDECIYHNHLYWIIPLSRKDKKFAEFCKQDELKRPWSQVWAAFGTKLGGKTCFLVHPKFHPFDMVCGAYFYQLAMQQPRDSKKWLDYLRTALEYDSIHAMQAYHFHLYSELASRNQTEQFHALSGIFIRLEKVVRMFGSYSRLMYAEAQVHKARHEIQFGSAKAAMESYDLAIKWCKSAANYKKNNSETDSGLTYIASIGRGLAASNSLDLPSAEKALEFLEAEKSQVDLKQEEVRVELLRLTLGR